MACKAENSNYLIPYRKSLPMLDLKHAGVVGPIISLLDSLVWILQEPDE